MRQYCTKGPVPRGPTTNVVAGWVVDGLSTGRDSPCEASQVLGSGLPTAHQQPMPSGFDSRRLHFFTCDFPGLAAKGRR